MCGSPGDDVGRNFLVGRLWKDAAGDELVLCRVRAAFEDAADVGVAHSGQGFELGGRCGVDIDKSGRGSGESGGLRPCGRGRNRKSNSECQKWKESAHTSFKKSTAWRQS
jgi:hypothetical protein